MSKEVSLLHWNGLDVCMFLSVECIEKGSISAPDKYWRRYFPFQKPIRVLSTLHFNVTYETISDRISVRKNALNYPNYSLPLSQ